MNAFTQVVWEVIEDDEELLTELRAIMRQQHQPFLNPAQAFEANTHIVKERLLERFRKWLDWLPTLPTSLIGLALAEEAMKCVEWQCIAEHLQRSNEAAGERRKNDVPHGR